MTPKEVLWHRIWLIVAAALIVAAYVNGFRISRAILLQSCRLATILTCMSSFCVVRGLKESAKNYFNIENKLWYASFGGFIYINSILVIVVSMFLLLTRLVIDPHVKRTLYPEQMQFLLPAFAILWLIVLNAPSKIISMCLPYVPNRSPRNIVQRRPAGYRSQSGKRVQRSIVRASTLRNGIRKGMGLLKRK